MHYQKAVARGVVWTTVFASHLFSAVCAVVAQDTLLLVERGQANAEIVVPDGATDAIRETAEDLAETIHTMSGARLDIVGERGVKPALILDVRDRDRTLAALAYHVWAEDNTLYFSGGSEWGVVNGVYAFLENELGCKWYVPGPLGMHIPERTTIRVGPVELQDEPDFESVTGFGRYSDPEAGSRWVRRNRIGGFPSVFHSHNWQNILPWRLFDEHPEWFAQLGSGRTPLQMCTTHPHVIETAIAKAIQYFDDNPEAPSFSLSPADNMSFCQCVNCRALDAELGVDPFVPGGSITDRLVYFCNQVALEVEKSYPDRYLAVYAYLNHTAPPRTVKPHRIVLPVLVHTPWDYCMHHPIDDPDCERNQVFADAVIGWSRLSAKLHVYDYWGHYHLCGHHGVVHNIRRDLPWLHQHGVVGFYGEMHPQRWTQPLNFYVPAKLAWDINADVDVIVNNYYKDMFGPASHKVAEFAQMFEDVMDGVPKDTARDFERAFSLDMTPEFTAEASALLDQAEEAIRQSNLAQDGKSAINERLRRYRFGLRLSVQLARIKQDRLASRMVRVIEGLEGMAALLEEIDADPSLVDMIELSAAMRQTREELERLPPYREIWKEAVPSPARRAELRRELDRGRTREVARALGYWTDWYLVGLWTNPGGDPMETHFPPEDSVDLRDTYDGRGGPIRWDTHQCESPYGIVDLREHFRPKNSEYTVAYAYTDLEVRGNANARLDVTCDDDIVLWVNDQLVFPVPGGDNSHERIRIRTQLHDGTNRVLAKILNKPHGFKFSLRIVSEDGRPLDAVVWP